MVHNSEEYLALAAIFGVLYGYVLYGTPLLPRVFLKSFITVAGTASIVLSLWRNIDDPASPIDRLLPVLIWYVSIVCGAGLRSQIELTYSWRDLFTSDIEKLLPKKEKKDV